MSVLANIGMLVLALLVLTAIQFVNTKFKQRYVLKYVDSIIFILPFVTLASLLLKTQVLFVMLAHIQICDCCSMFVGVNYRMTKMVIINIASVLYVIMNP